MNTLLKCTTENCRLAEQLRDFAPVPGCDFKKLLLVELERGESVPVHNHHGHTVLFYPGDSSPVIITPLAGMMIYLPPQTMHSVPAVLEDRASVAMIVEPVK